jgi:DNA-binding winged helix-turn-helix (wHTH) protein
MASQPSSPQVIRFGTFEVDLQARELRKSGLKLKVYDQTFQLLGALLERPGEVITREELRQKLWPGDTFVDFDHGINTAVKKLRDVLGDSAESPRFVETLARRGYRFLTPVHGAVRLPAVNDGPATVSQPAREAREIDGNNEYLTDGRQQPPGMIASLQNREILAWILLGATSLALAVLAVVHFRHQISETHAVRFQVPLPDHVTLTWIDIPVLSPNGRRLAFVGAGSDSKRHLWLHSLDSLTTQLLPGTEGAAVPFWSPDSRFVAFEAENERKLKKIDVMNGPPQTLCQIGGFVGGAWSRDGIILFSQWTSSQGSTLYRVSAMGGQVEPVLPFDKSRPENDQPRFLPDGRHFLYRSLSRHEGAENGAIYLGSLDSKETRMLIPTASNVVYAPPGFLIYSRGETLMAQGFDVGKLELTGWLAALKTIFLSFPPLRTAF